MKFIRRHKNLFLLVSAFLFAAALSAPKIGHGESPGSPSNSSTQGQSRVKPTVLTPDRRTDSAGGSIADKNVLDLAATNNATLRNELSWMFAGKQQHGWYLYTALIGRLLKTEESPSSKGFAAALGEWQQKSGLKPTGVLDEESLDTMIVQWQDMRLKNREAALPEQLITVPASEFYDPERLEPLRQVERETYTAYKALVAAAVADPSLHLAHDSAGRLAATEKYLKIISSFRSREYQEQLRRQSPNAGRAGLALNSPHFTGRALDLYVGGDPVDTKDSNRALQVQTPVYRWLVRNAERFGFRPYFYEPWHWEYVK